MTGTSFDNWGVAANSHLMAYVLRKMAVKRCFNARETLILVAYKNAWADDMRDIGQEVPVEKQKACWADCMQRAEAQMAQAAAA